MKRLMKQSFRSATDAFKDPYYKDGTMKKLCCLTKFPNYIYDLNFSILPSKFKHLFLAFLKKEHIFSFESPFKMLVCMCILAELTRRSEPILERSQVRRRLSTLNDLSASQEVIG